MGSLIELEYQGTPMGFEESGWFNATQAAARFGKRPVDWLALDSAQEYISTLAEILNCEKSSLLKTKRGRHQGGTWMSPRLATVFTRWLDTRFAIWCDLQIDGLIRGNHPRYDWKRMRHEATASHKVMGEALRLVREEQGKATAAHHYANEARLTNWVVTGEFAGLDRDALSAQDLSLLADLEVRNAALIGRGMPYQDRKVLLEQYAKELRGGQNQAIPAKVKPPARRMMAEGGRHVGV